MFVFVKATATWLDLSDDDRLQAVQDHLLPILDRHRGSVTMRFFGIDMCWSRASDVWMWEVRDVGGYEALFDELCSSVFWTKYFDLIEIVSSVEQKRVENIWSWRRAG